MFMPNTDTCPITLQGDWSTTDDFPAMPFDLVLFSAALVELAQSILSVLCTVFLRLLDGGSALPKQSK